MTPEITGDWWLDEQKGIWQPKYDIADYVESCGISVPQRFSDIGEAVYWQGDGSDRTIIIRSEHPNEYNGASGIAESFTIGDTEIEIGRGLFDGFGMSIDEFRDRIQEIYSARPMVMGIKPSPDRLPNLFEADWMLAYVISTKPELGLELYKEKTLRNQRIHELANRLGVSADNYFEKLSFSFWEYKPGINITIAADSAIKNRHHLMFNIETDDNTGNVTGGLVVEDGEIVHSNEDSSLSRSLPADLPFRAIALFENVRALSRFSQTNIPLMEMQLAYDDDLLYFLQTHRTRDFRESTSIIDHSEFDLSDGWHKAQLVRGHTNGQVETLATSLYYPVRLLGRLVTGFVAPAEPATFDLLESPVFSEWAARSRHTFVSPFSWDGLYSEMADNHTSRSSWFKSDVAYSLGSETYRDLVSQDESLAVYRLAESNRMAKVVLDYVSDGRNGFVRRNPAFDGPVLADI